MKCQKKIIINYRKLSIMNCDIDNMIMDKFSIFILNHVILFTFYDVQCEEIDGNNRNFFKLNYHSDLAKG